MICGSDSIVDEDQNVVKHDVVLFVNQFFNCSEEPTAFIFEVVQEETTLKMEAISTFETSVHDVFSEKAFDLCLEMLIINHKIRWAMQYKVTLIYFR